MKYYIQKLVDNVWITQDDIGFNTIVEANEHIFISLKIKSEFWTNYRLTQK